VYQFAVLFIPLGLVCGLVLAWAVISVTRRNLSMRSILRAAARRREFFVEYQPVIELGSRRWIGAEALVRWRRGSRIIRPDLFIPSAEESGVITFITECVAAIIAADLPGLLSIDAEFQVALNLSAVDLRSESSLATIQQILRAEGVRPANLEVEATERGFLQGAEARELLARVRSLGITVAIDDFGTGYSSLACLQTLGLDTLKIDKAFVDTIGTDGATSQVVLHIIHMAHSLKLEMVAEGVETEEQALLLERRGVHYAQGWLFARPMSISSLREALLAKSVEDRKVSA
jgi:sensor c-di-GMP phosphodiesterase-like protein